MNSIHIQKYIEFLDTFQKNSIDDLIVLLLIEDVYYIFYNEKFGKNANDLVTKFKYDGMYRYNNDICYYVGFDKSNLSQFISDSKTHNIVVLSEKIMVSNIYQKPKKSIFSSFNKNAPFNNINMIQEMFTMYGCLPNIVDPNKKKDFGKYILAQGQKQEESIKSTNNTPI